MSLKNKVADQMYSSRVSLRNPWIVSCLIPIFIFACGNFTLFMVTSLILCVSACLFLTHRSFYTGKQVTSCDVTSFWIAKSILLRRKLCALTVLTQPKHEVDVVEQEQHLNDQEVEFDVMGSDQNGSNQVKNLLGLPDSGSSSESEIIDPFSCTTEEDSDFDGWRYSGESCRRADCSDGSISDEESLIEIELRGGHYVGYKDYKVEEEHKFCRRQKSPDSVLWWPEEENMIEIDLTVGSIKCS